MTTKHFLPFVLLSLAIAPIVLHAQEDNISVTASTIVGGGEIKNANDRVAIAEPKTQKVTTEASNMPLKGDYFQFKAKVSKFRLSDPSGSRSEVTAPKGACFRVSQEIPDVTQSDGSKSVMARGTFVTGWDGWPFWEWSYGFFTNLVLPPYICAGGLELKAATSLIDPDASYDVPKQMLISDRDRLRFGWTYGVLVAPFKYYPKTGEFNAGATVGPYLGYRLYDRPGAASVGALSIGTANATITVTDADGNKSSSTETGISTSVAWLVDVKNSFNVGFLAGKDYFSKSKNIPGSNKLWFSVSFGLNLN